MSNWTPAEEEIIARIMRAENATRMEAIRAMRRRTTADGIYRAPAQPAPGHSPASCSPPQPKTRTDSTNPAKHALKPTDKAQNSPDKPFTKGATQKQANQWERMR